jgi:hypothetical protein
MQGVITMKQSYIRAWLMLGLASVDCAAGQSETEVRPDICGEDIDSAAISANEVTERGTAHALAANPVLQQHGDLRYARRFSGDMGPTMRTEMTLHVLADVSSARLIKTSCADVLAMTAVLDLTTTDGSLQGHLSGTLRAEESAIRFMAVAPLASVAGTYDTAPAASMYQQPQFQLQAFLGDMGAGMLSIYESNPHPVVPAIVADWSSGAPL